MFSKYFRSKKSENRKKDKEISLVVENSSYTVSMRKSVLVKYSAVFRKMAEGGELGKSREVKLRGVTAIGIQKIVEYIRADSVHFQNPSEAIETLRAAYLYQVPAMNDIGSHYLVTAIDSGSVCDILEFASSYSFDVVEYHCLRFIDRYAEEILNSSSFSLLRKGTVTDIVKRHSMNVSSEISVFRAVLTWAIQDCLRRGVDAENIQEVFKSVKPLLGYVRFAALSREELFDPDVDRFFKLMSCEAVVAGRRSSLDARSRSSTSLQAREHVFGFDYGLDVLKCDEHAVKNGESFCLRIEILKGRVFLTGVTLAFERFVSSKNTSCLYAALSATNVQTADQRCARGTFMSTGEEAVLELPSPLMARESERVEIALQVKRAVNICSAVVNSDIQIAMPETKDVAMKIIPSSTAGGTERSMYKSVKYFY